MHEPSVIDTLPPTAEQAAATSNALVRHLELEQRLTPELYRRRFHRQAHEATRCLGTGATLLHLENVEWVHVIFYHLLRALGLYRWGVRNARAIDVREHVVPMARLPAAFDGYRILQLTDLHLDLDPALIEVLAERLATVEYDVCVITGDFRAHTFGEWDSCLRECARLVPHLRGEVYAVLGNHDALEMVPPLEDLGIRVLLNEAVRLERAPDALFLAGIDDSYIYQTHDFAPLARVIPNDAAAVLLSHSPEPYREAAAAGFELMMCGHTHGGQVCLPGGFALWKSTRCPRRMVAGAWRHGALRGYTSRGTGTCGVPVRFFCPPEITVHKLQRATSSPAPDAR
ncbi:MAG: metallophosphoesterase [Planctomycetota bacterium]